MSEAAITTKVPLASKTTLELGGAAEYYLEATNDSDVVDALHFARDKNLFVTVLGGGSNVVISDEGIAGLVIAMRSRGIETKTSSDHVDYELAAGEPWDDFVAESVQNNLSGVECLSGIPGLVGATPIQNVGAYGPEIADTLQSVDAFDRETMKIVTITRDACDFRYRDSMFKHHPNRYIVLRVRYRLSKGEPKIPQYAELNKALGGDDVTPSVKQVRDTVLALRRGKSMVIDPTDENRRSAGSFFLNPILTKKEAARIASTNDQLPRYEQADGRVKIAAAWLIEKSGVTKGMRRGHVGVSTKHALALVHHGGGRAEELLAFAREIRGAVRSRFGVTLVPEPVLLGFSSPNL